MIVAKYFNTGIDNVRTSDLLARKPLTGSCLLVLQQEGAAITTGLRIHKLLKSTYQTPELLSSFHTWDLTGRLLIPIKRQPSRLHRGQVITAIALVFIPRFRRICVHQAIKLPSLHRRTPAATCSFSHDGQHEQSYNTHKAV